MAEQDEDSAVVWECGPHANAWGGHDARCRQVPDPMTRPQPTASEQCAVTFMAGTSEIGCRLNAWHDGDHEVSDSVTFTSEWAERTHVEQPTESADAEALAEVFVDLVWPIEDAREATQAVIASGWLAAYVQAARDDERARVCDRFEALADKWALWEADDEEFNAARNWHGRVLGTVVREARGGAR